MYACICIHVCLSLSLPPSLIMPKNRSTAVLPHIHTHTHTQPTTVETSRTSTEELDRKAVRRLIIVSTIVMLVVVAVTVVIVLIRITTASTAYPQIALIVNGIGVTPLTYSSTAPLDAKAGYIPASPLLSPLLGWNSQHSFHYNLDETLFRAQVQAAVNLGWKDAGYRYIIIGDHWVCPIDDDVCNHGTVVDSSFIQQPDIHKWPSSSGLTQPVPNFGNYGFQQLADWIHQEMDMLIGIHVVAGFPDVANYYTSFSAQSFAAPSGPYRWCPSCGQPSLGLVYTGNYAYWYFNPDNPAAQDYLNRVFTEYATWGIDYIKIDCLTGVNSYDYPINEWNKTVAMYQIALAQAGRPMIINLSPGYLDTPIPIMAAQNQFLSTQSHMYRQNIDSWDDMGGDIPSYNNTNYQSSMYNLFSFYGPNSLSLAGVPTNGSFVRADLSWPDMDVISAGGNVLRYNNYSAPSRPSLFTHDQQRAIMTMFSMFRAPLIMGGDMLAPDYTSIAIFTNPELLFINQYSGNASIILNTGSTVKIKANRVDSRLYWTAQSSMASTNTSVMFNSSEHGFISCTFRELWLNQTLGVGVSNVTSIIPPTGVSIVQLSNCR